MQAGLLPKEYLENIFALVLKLPALFVRLPKPRLKGLQVF